MLQRAASNAYSWWWASHIRTRQSNWLEQNLQDMEEKVKNTLLLIEEDADSFAQRAEMYYKKKPELINFVEESYRAYRALAERYDHISGELHNANNTIATVFPQGVQFAMDEDDDDDEINPKAFTHPVDRSKLASAPPIDHSKLASAHPLDHSKFCKVPTASAQLKIPSKDARKPLSPNISKARKTDTQMNNEKAREEIDKLQKGILVLQTEKEFVMSSYESALTKYLDIEKKITETQKKVCSLQDEFTEAAVIEDDDARGLMTATALKSCKETLVKLQEQQSRSIEEAGLESNRIKDAEEKLRALKDKFFHQTENQNLSDETKVTQSNGKSFEEDISSLKRGSLELQLECEEVKELYEINPETPLTVADLAEKIDELVNKVICMETEVSSQTAQIKRLRLESDELQKHLESLEEDKMNSVDGSNENLSTKIREAEEELHGIKDLNRTVEVRNNMLQTDFTKARCSLDDLSEKMQCSKSQDKVEIIGSSEEEKDVLIVEPPEQFIEQDMIPLNDNSVNLEGNNVEQEEGTKEIQKQDMMPLNDNSANLEGNNVEQEEGTKEIQDPRQCVKQEQCKEQDMMPFNNSATLETRDIPDPRQSVECEHCKEPDMMPLNDNSTNLEADNVEQQQTEKILDLREHDEDQKNPDQSEACHSSNDASEKLQNQNKQEEVENRDSFKVKDPALNVEPQKQNAEQENFPKWLDKNQEGVDNKESTQSKESIVEFEPLKQNTEQEDLPNWLDQTQEGVDNKESSRSKESIVDFEPQKQKTEQEDFPDWLDKNQEGVDNEEPTQGEESTTDFEPQKQKAQQEDSPNWLDQNQEGVDTKESTRAIESIVDFEPQKQKTEPEDVRNWQGWNQQEDVENKESSRAKDSIVDFGPPKQKTEQVDFPNWQNWNQQEDIENKESSRAKGSIVNFEPLKQKTEQEDFPSWHDWNQLEDVKNRDSSQAKDSALDVEPQPQNPNTEDESFPNWQQLCLNGLEGREKVLLAEYTSILRNYKETKRKLLNIEKKNQDELFEMAAQIRELKSMIAMKDEEIRSLRQRLSLLQASHNKNSHNHMKESKDAESSRYDDTGNESRFSFSGFRTESLDWPKVESIEDVNAKSTPNVVTGMEGPSIDKDIMTVIINERNTTSAMEEKFRRDIDEQLEENLQFWLRFSTTFHQIQKFQTVIQELQAELSKSKKDNKKQESSATSSADQVVKSEAGPIDKNLRALQTDLKVWLEQNASLKEELHRRFSSLCNIQDEIARALEMGSKNGQEFTAYQAAKFQGEVLNMQQENKKVAEELQAGLDHVIGLQSEVEKILSKLHGAVGLSGSKNFHHHVKHSISRTRIPLRAFIFGAKQKKPSLFSCMNPALQKQSSDLNVPIHM